MLYSSQELYLANEETHGTLVELENVFPESPFLKTQRALLCYHCKGMHDLLSPDSTNAYARLRFRGSLVDIF